MKAFYHSGESLPFSVQFSTEERGVIVYHLALRIDEVKKRISVFESLKSPSSIIENEKKILKSLVKVATDFENKTKSSIT